MVRKGILNTFALEFVDKERAKLLQRYTDIDAFIHEFHVDAVLTKALEDAANKEGVDPIRSTWPIRWT